MGWYQTCKQWFAGHGQLDCWNAPALLHCRCMCPALLQGGGEGGVVRELSDVTISGGAGEGSRHPWKYQGSVFAQRAHSANYYGDYPGNNPENHAPAESCTINSKLKNSNI